MKDVGFLARWSRRKIQARSTPATPPPAEPAPAGPAAAAPAAAPVPSAPLPPLESLTPQSDFAPFMRAEVDPAVKGQALKTLFSDPALYPMDGLDVYIDDYTRADPLPEGWLERLNQFAALDGAPAEPAASEAAQAPLAQAAAPDPAPGAQPAPQASSSDTPDAKHPPAGSMNRNAI